MAARTIVSEEELLEYYKENQSTMDKTMYKIAENDDYDIEIYITENTKNLPCITVMADSDIIRESETTADRLESLAKEIYSKYLTDRAFYEIVNSQTDEFDNTDDDIIDVREDELSLAVEGFIYTATDSTIIDIKDEEIEKIKDHFLAYLYKECGIEIYRPMYIEYPDGTEEYEEYPYSKLDI